MHPYVRKFVVLRRCSPLFPPEFALPQFKPKVTETQQKIVILSSCSVTMLRQHKGTDWLPAKILAHIVTRERELHRIGCFFSPQRQLLEHSTTAPRESRPFVSEARTGSAHGSARSSSRLIFSRSFAQPAETARKIVHQLANSSPKF